MFAGVSTTIAVLTNISLAAFTLLKNPRKRLNQSLALIAVSMTVWQIANFFADFDTEYVLFWNRASFVGPIFMAFFFFMFTNYITDRPRKKRDHVTTFFISLFVTTLVFSPWVVESVQPRLSGSQIAGFNLERGILYPLIIFWILILATWSFSVLFKHYQTAFGSDRAQLQFVFLAMFLAATASIITNIILPLLTGSTEYAKLAPVASVLLTGFLAYAILKHRFLDIRLVVARSVAYVLLLGTIGLAYGLSLFGISNLLLKTQGFDLSQVIVNTILAIVLVVTFQPLKRFFDRITNNIFYRDAYDSQKVLNSLSELLASEMKLVRIARKSLTLITDNLHLSYGLFIIMGDDGEVYQTERQGKSPQRAPSAHMLKRLDENLILKDELDGSEKKDVLDRFDAAAVLRLKTKEGIVGYILLGRKESGNIYTQQDVKFLRIVANELSIAVENSRNFEQIQEFNETLQEKVDEATKKLRRTNKKLRQLDEAKDEFITMASHQLRTPLTTIKGYVSMMLEGDAGKITDKQKDMLKAAYTSSDRMVYLIADLLNVSRLSTGKFVIQSKRVNLADIVRSEIDQLERHLEAKNIETVFNAPDEMPPVELDENKIRQVIMNFIDNAIFYTHEDGKIEVTLEEKGKAIELRVKDNGIGVPKEEQHQLFTKFFRATNAKKARPDGTGLGLYLAKKVITAQGGTIIFESKEGEGSTFGFSFPKDRILVTSSSKESSETTKTAE